MWLKDELTKNQNCRYFKEYDLGHLGLIIPKDKTIFFDMLAQVKRHSSNDVERLLELYLTQE